MTVEVQRRGPIRPISDLPALVTPVSPLVEVEAAGQFYQAPYVTGGNSPDIWDYTGVQFPFSADFLDVRDNAAAPTSSTGAAITGGKLVCAGASGNGLVYAAAGGSKLDEMVGCLGTLNFTMEGWFQTTSTVAQGALMEFTTLSFAAGNWGIQINGDGVVNSGLLAFWAKDVSGSVPVVLTPAGTKYNDGVRHHVRIVRNGNQFTIYVDGVGKIRFTSAVAFTDNVANLTFGVSGFGTRACAVTLDNWRILKGLSVCAGISFTVPTPPFPTS